MSKTKLIKDIRGEMALATLSPVIERTERIIVVSSFDRLTDSMKDILLGIKKDKMTPTKLESQLDINIVTVSRYLKHLYSMGLIDVSRRGRNKYFKLTETGEKIVSQLDKNKSREILRLLL